MRNLPSPPFLACCIQWVALASSSFLVVAIRSYPDSCSDLRQVRTGSGNPSRPRRLSPWITRRRCTFAGSAGSTVSPPAWMVCRILEISRAPGFSWFVDSLVSTIQPVKEIMERLAHPSPSSTHLHPPCSFLKISCTCLSWPGGPARDLLSAQASSLALSPARRQALPLACLCPARVGRSGRLARLERAAPQAPAWRLRACWFGPRLYLSSCAWAR